MKKLITILLIGFSLVAVAALPPDMQADRYLVQVEKALKSKDSDFKKDDKAADIMDKIMALKDQHNLEMPIEFYFKYAKITLNGRSFNRGKKALNAIEHYLAVAGKTGTNYVEALGLYDTALSFKLIVANSVAEVKQLIKLGADVNARNKYKNTPFHLAVEYQSDPEIIKALIQAGADVNARNKYKSTPLHKLEKYNENMNAEDKATVKSWLKNPSLLR